MENSNYPVPKQEYKVLVRCYTYNHSKYIEDALNGFARQKTNFPFVCFVMDDASTDGEQEVIKKWMESECNMSKAETIDIPTSIVIIVPHKTNSSCTFAFYLLKQNLYRKSEEKMNHLFPWRDKCEYEAFCEGDDYWVNENKLQMQADYLDANTDCALVRTDFQRYIQKTKILEASYCHEGPGRFIVDEFEPYVLNAWFNGPLTIMYRKSVFKYYRFLLDKPCFHGTIIYTFTACLHYKMHYIDVVTAHYRVLEKSACHFDNFRDVLAFRDKTIKTRIYFANECNSRIRFRLWCNCFYRMVGCINRPSRFKYFFKSLSLSIGYFCKLFLWKRKEYALPKFNVQNSM